MSYEYYDVIFSDNGVYKSFKTEAESPEDAEDQLRQKVKITRHPNRFEIIEVIPMGIISGFEITIYDQKIIEL